MNVGHQLPNNSGFALNNEIESPYYGDITPPAKTRQMSMLYEDPASKETFDPIYGDSDDKLLQSTLHDNEQQSEPTSMPQKPVPKPRRKLSTNEVPKHAQLETSRNLSHEQTTTSSRTERNEDTITDIIILQDDATIMELNVNKHDSTSTLSTSDSFSPSTNTNCHHVGVTANRTGTEKIVLFLDDIDIYQNIDAIMEHFGLDSESEDGDDAAFVHL